MSKQHKRPNLRSFIDGPSVSEEIVTEVVETPAPAPAAVAEPEAPAAPQPTAKVVRMAQPKARPAKAAASPAAEPQTRLVDRAKQETVYLEPIVRDQLLELAFTERKKKHALMLEALDLLFKNRGLKSIKQLTGA